MNRQSRKKKSQKSKAPSLGRLRLKKALHHAHAVTGRGGKTGTEELEIRTEFELNIEEGQDQVMDETLGEIEQEARIILEEGKDDIVEMARSLAPVRTGALSASIYGEVEDVRGITVGATVSYAAYQEYGTSRMSPHSFLQPAIDENEPMIQEALDQMIAEKLAEDTSEDDPEFEFERTMEELEEK